MAANRDRIPKAIDMEIVQVTDTYGTTFQATAYAVDRAMARFLPASVNDLLPLVREHFPNVRDLHTVSECLIILASVGAGR